MGIVRRRFAGIKPRIQDTATALRRHFVAHNWKVLRFALLASSVSVVAWGFAYTLFYWLLLLWVTVVEDAYAPLPVHYSFFFAAGAGALLIVAWSDRATGAQARPPDRKKVWEVLADIALAVPRSTLAIVSTLSAWRWLSRRELRLAVDLIERVAREKQISIYNAPLDIPNEATREKVIFALLLVRVLEIRFAEDNAWLRLSPDRPKSLRMDRLAAGAR